ncbi:hypothetical protein GPUN_0890 [Glaciecola punicea ACAM 611]|uniref:Uncharacterized protein n=1 Tax=Glaciecola punicea ACAM 611 TaxID=1121923 RepID=H5T9P5_9ALTE|nr:hypothetical protein GPUN_0890 [Glaciecola punicea ACAM 611]
MFTESIDIKVTDEFSQEKVIAQRFSLKKLGKLKKIEHC